MSGTTAPEGAGRTGDPHVEREAARWPGSDSTPPSVTGPTDYALINTTYLAGQGRG